MSKQTAWEMPFDELVDELVAAAKRSGFSGSGQVISMSQSSDAREVSYLAGVIKARMAGISPPFKCGDRVRLKGKSESVRVVWKVHYSPPGTSDSFRLQFERGGELCPANDWKLAPSEVP